MYKVICVILTALMPVLSLFGYNPDKRDTSYTADVASQTFRKGGKAEANFEFTETAVNTVEVELKNNVSTQVKIFAGDELVYSRTGTEKYRFCAFGTINTDNIKVCASDGNAITSVKVSLKLSNDKAFRVTAYLTDDYGTKTENISSESLDVITDIIIFGNCTFDENGVLSVNDEVIEQTIKNIDAVADGRDIKKHINILGPGAQSGDTWDEQMDDLAKRYSTALKTDTLCKDIISVTEKYGLDGFFLDYEYPLKAKYWKTLGDFLKKIDEESDISIGLAVADWNMSVINKGIVDTVDMFEFMQYDLFDENGEHASFDTAVGCVTTVKEMFIPKQKADMGIPFYGRPEDRGAFWPTYKDYAEKLGDSDKTQTENGVTYFNCAQTVYDKTAYALDKELGGMMVWHYSCDIKDINSELSLFGTMKRCIEDRVK